MGSSIFSTPSSYIIGDVKIGDRSSIWYNTTIRGDVAGIVIGRETNIQDGSTIHATFNRCGTTLGDRVTIGHNVVLHGCEIGDGTLIGMGSIVMDLCKVGRHCIVGAGSLLTEKSVFEDGSLILGRPGKFIRKLTKEEIEMLEVSADNYLLYKTWYENPKSEGVRL
jgi:carbonic anhydrase/acetyltransferase-like protein (isoleucine patch superfamily)